MMEGKESNHSAGESTARAKASTQDILGRNGTRSTSPPKWARHYENLTKLREQILATKEMLAQDANANSENPIFGEHMADAATDSYDRDWALTMLSSGQNAFYEVEAALDRLSHGTYGFCELTGQAIKAERLRAIPWTRFCAAAQRELEDKGLWSRTQLGELGRFSESNGLSESADQEVEVSAGRAVEKRTAS